MSVVIRLLSFLKKYTRWAILTYTCLIAATSLGLVIPELIKRAIDNGIRYDPVSRVAGGSQQFLLLSALAIIGVSLFRGLFSFGQVYLGEFLSQKVAYDIRNRLYDRFQSLSLAFHDKAQTGQLMSRATQDVEAIRFFVSMGSMGLLTIILMFFGITIIMLIINWQLALLSLIYVPITALWAMRMGIKLRPAWLSIQQKLAILGTILEENLSGIRVVKAFSQEREEIRKFDNAAKGLYSEGLNSNQIQAFSIPLITLMFTLVSAFVLWYSGRAISSGTLTIGEFFQFYSYLALLAMPMRMLGFMVNLYSRATSAGQRVFEILDTESAVKEKAGAIDLPRPMGEVIFDKVSFGYDSISPVLNNINIHVKPGQMVAVLGATGSGKSTLVNLIPRFYDVSRGKITIDGTDIRDVTFASLRRNIGLVQQDVFIFSASIKDNISYGAVEAPLEKIIEAASVAHLHDFIVTLPQGYDNWVGERGITLSGGQRQRLAIARTLLIDPPILILDDSTSSVDTETEYLIQQAVRKLARSRTTFVIAHRLQSIMDADQIIVLDRGQIVEQGIHQELMSNGRIYPQIYEIQFRGQENEALVPATDNLALKGQE